MDAGDSAETDRLAALALSALVVLIPLSTSTLILNKAHPRAFDATEWTGIDLFDVGLVALAAVWIRRRGPQRLLLESKGMSRLLALAALGLALVSFAAHPSSHGLEMLLRGLAVVAVVDAAHRLSGEHRRWFLVTMVAAGATQAVLGLAQSVHGRQFGIDLLEYSNQPFRFGGTVAGQGGFFHPYLLATYLLAAIGAALVLHGGSARRPLVYVAVVVLAAGLALTFSRSALLGCIGALMLLAWSGMRDRSRWVFAAFLCLGLAVGGLLGLDGWVARGGGTTSTASVDSGRRELAAAGLRLVEQSPVVGVGLGNYQTALRDVEHGRLIHSHNPGLQIAAEAGLAAGLLTLVLLGAGTVWTIRAGVVPTIVLVLSAPFWIVDAPGVVFPVGLAVTGLWMAVIVIAALDSRDPRQITAASRLGVPGLAAS